MTTVLRAKLMAIVGAALASIACSSGGGGTGVGTGGSDAGAVGTGGSDAGAAGTDAGGVGSGGTGGSGGSDAGSSTGGVARGSIRVDQSTNFGTTDYSVSAGFAKLGSSGSGTSGATNTTVGSCTATVIPSTSSDAGVVPPVVTALNAGTITVNGGSGDAGPATLVYGPYPGDGGHFGYPGVHGAATFYAGGDTLVATGAGGPDLPAFTARVVAPHDVTLTAPACDEAKCTDLDRTADLNVTWTGGGAGSVEAIFETLSNTETVILFCDFGAAAGHGTIASSLLMKLGKAGDPGVAGIEGFISTNKANFKVGAVDSTFTVDGQGTILGLTVSK